MSLLVAAVHDTASAAALAGAGVDRLVGYHSSVYRAQGLPSVAGLLPWASANQQTLDLLPAVLAGSDRTPVLATVCASDGLLPIPQMLDLIVAAGAVGVVNAPTLGLLTGPVRAAVEEVGLGMTAEIDLVRQARERGLEAWAYVFDPVWMERAIDAGATGLILHLGITGFATQQDWSRQLDECLPVLADPAAPPLLLHGGPLRQPADLEELFASHPAARGAAGFFGASSFLQSDDLGVAIATWRRLFDRDAPSKWNGPEGGIG